MITPLVRKSPLILQALKLMIPETIFDHLPSSVESVPMIRRPLRMISCGKWAPLKLTPSALSLSLVTMSQMERSYPKSPHMNIRDRALFSPDAHPHAIFCA